MSMANQIQGLRPDGTLPTVAVEHVQQIVSDTGGSGIEEVSGTVALTTTGPRIREFYTVGSATIGGETFPADTALAVRRTASGAFQVAVVGEAGGWRAFTGPGGGPVISVTPAAPTMDDEADTYTIPTSTGVDYYVDGLPKSPGVTFVGDVTVTVTVTALARPGYVIAGTSEWALQFTAFEVGSYEDEVLVDAPTHFVPLDDPSGASSARDIGTSPSSWTPSGVTFSADAIGDVPTSATFTDTSTVTAGVSSMLGGETLWTVEAVIAPTAQSNGRRAIVGPGRDQWAVAGNVNYLGAYLGSAVTGDDYLADNPPLHVAAVSTATHLRLYVNGTMTNQIANTETTPAETTPIAIGANEDRGIAGRIAGVAIYKGKALSESRIAAHARAAGLA